MPNLRVSTDTRDKLLILKGVMLKKNFDEVIIQLMLIREYDEAFFERQRERTQSFLSTGVRE